MVRQITETERGILICSRRAQLRLQASSTGTPFRVAVRAFIEAEETRNMYRIAIVL